MCRLSTVAPTLTHKAGFHPTAVFGAMGAAAGVGAALKLNPRQMVDALGTVASMASGIIEYLAEGAWTKRLHAGWAAQSGIRAALLGRAGFVGPRTVFEGVHGFFHGFANTTKGDYDALIGDFGERWVTETLAFKPYPCGTMTHPYIDCARRLAARGIKADDVVDMVCEVGEGTVHRLWEPLAAKQKPANGYAGKFSTPYCIAAGFVRGNVGLGDFSDAAVRDPAVLALAGKVRYQIDPKNPYPKNFTGHIRATLRDGTVVEERQPYMRGGAQEPLTRADIQDKFLLNAANGGWDADRAARSLEVIGTLFDGPVDRSRCARRGDARNAQRRRSRGMSVLRSSGASRAGLALIAGALALVAGIGPAWAQISSFSVSTDQPTSYPGNLTSWPDEHVTFFPSPRPTDFSFSDRARSRAGWAARSRCKPKTCRLSIWRPVWAMPSRS